MFARSVGGRSGLFARSVGGRSGLFEHTLCARSGLFAHTLLYIVVLVNLMKGVCKQDTASTECVCKQALLFSLFLSVHSASVKLSQLLQ